MLISAAGRATRVSAEDIPEQGRATQGKRIVKLEDGDRIVEVARVARQRDEERPAATRSAQGGPQLELIG